VLYVAIGQVSKIKSYLILIENLISIVSAARGRDRVRERGSKGSRPCGRESQTAAPIGRAKEPIRGGPETGVRSQWTVSRAPAKSENSQATIRRSGWQRSIW